MIDYDVETTGLQPYSGKNEAFLWIFRDTADGFAEAIAYSPSGAAIPTWGVEAGGSPERQHAHGRIQEWFNRAARDPEGIRAWNSKFDRGFGEMAGQFVLPPDGKWHDGMLVAQAIDERRSVALKAVASQLFGEEAADPQKKLKDWLNHENSRRKSLGLTADKARVGKLKVKYIQGKCLNKDCKTVFAGDPFPYACPECGGTDIKTTNKTRFADDAEVAAILAEWAEFDAGEEGYIRANYSNVPRDIMEPYALEDVILTAKVADVYMPRVEQMPDMQRVTVFEDNAMDALFAIEKRGLPVANGGVEYRKLEQEVLRNLIKLEDRVQELAQEGDPLIYGEELAGDRWGFGGHYIIKNEDGSVEYQGGVARLDEFNPKSTPQVLAALKARGADMSFMTPDEDTGKIGADADNLRAVPDDLAAAILDFRAEFKVLSTYVRPMISRSYVSSMNVYKEPFVGPDSRIHTTYRQVGARTGRMSSADPNVQNQPRDDLRLRYNVVAEPGHVLVTCDLSNIEMVLFAAYCGPGKLLSAVKEGADLHALTARMLGLRDRKRPGGGVETARQLGKVYNFTTIYGGGLRSIKKYFRCDDNTAKLYKRRYADAYPEVVRLQNKIGWKLEDDGYVQDKLISGRRYRLKVSESYKATNYLVQGTAASLLKYAVINLHNDGVPMVALVHDEIVAHVPIDEAQDVAKLIEQRMTEFPGLQGVVPIRAEADIVTRWSDAKILKDADGVPYYFDPEWANVPRRYVNA